jgi:Lon protease-like protein
MADEVIEIPLFPLNLVLFPGMVQPLHIFEPRYREMTRHCLDTNVSFGVTLALPGSEFEREIPAQIGTLARIVNYQRLADGRYNLITAGGRRFEALELRHDKPYLCCVARLLPEVLGEGDIAMLAGETRALLDDYLGLILALMDSGDKTIEIPHDTIELSYFIAVCLPCDDDVKQGLLQSSTAVERLTCERDLLRQEIGAISAQLYHDTCDDDDDDDDQCQPGARQDPLH